MDTYLKLKRNCKQNTTGLTPHRFAIVGDSATQMLAYAIKGKAWQEGLAFDVFEADYDQIKSQIMDPISELYKHQPQTIMLYMCSEKLYEKFCQTELKFRCSFAENVFREIRDYWNVINSNINTNIIQFTFREINDEIFGNYAAKTDMSFFYQIKKLNLLLMDCFKEFGNVFPLCLDSIYSRWGQEQIFDSRLYYSAKMTLNENILPVIAEQTVYIVKAISGIIKKCVVCDLDNTLWGGIIGDDGYENIEIGSYRKGAAFSELQRWLKELKNRGILLAVCSKNQKETAMEAFEKHPEMILKLDDFTIFVANWDDKASNIRDIQRRLNIGMDSLVFLDDNVFERNAVRTLIPEITVPELPDDPANYVSYLRDLNLFETASYSDEDNNRTKQYRIEADRAEKEADYASYDDYLISLEMIAEAKPFNTFYLPRIAQLTQRSNQFNLRTVRYTEAELKNFINNDKYITFYFTLKDKFGEYGLIAVVILEKQSDEELFISEWLMSCRVLKRGMEEFIINKIMDSAKKHGYKTVIGEYIKSPKNAMVEHIYEKMGFKKIESGSYSSEVHEFKNIGTYIEEDNEINE